MLCLSCLFFSLIEAVNNLRPYERSNNISIFFVAPLLVSYGWSLLTASNRMNGAVVPQIKVKFGPF